jgi:hypothetical protein
LLEPLAHDIAQRGHWDGTRGIQTGLAGHPFVKLFAASLDFVRAHGTVAVCVEAPDHELEAVAARVGAAKSEAPATPIPPVSTVSAIPAVLRLQGSCDQEAR